MLHRMSSSPSAGPGADRLVKVSLQGIDFHQVHLYWDSAVTVHQTTGRDYRITVT